jgi:hypothetical protein
MRQDSSGASWPQIMVLLSMSFHVANELWSTVAELSESLSDGLFTQRLSEDTRSGVSVNEDKERPVFHRQKYPKKRGSRKSLPYLACNGIL